LEHAVCESGKGWARGGRKLRHLLRLLVEDILAARQLISQEPSVRNERERDNSIIV
jgi:hypothetical protein